MRKIFLLTSFILQGYFGFSQSWQQVDGPWGGSVYALGNEGNKIFAGTQDGVYLSVNNGNSWALTNNEVDGQITSIASSGSTVFVGTQSGIYLTNNDGVTWQKANIGLNNTDVLSLAVNGNYVFAGTYDGIFLSDNNGLTWSIIDTNIEVNALAISGNNIFAGGSGVSLSTDNGTSWKSVGNLGYIESLTISGNNIFAGSSDYDGIFMSSDNGTAWTQVLSDYQVTALAISGNNILAGTSGNGLFVSSDGGTTWSPDGNGMISGFIYSFAVTPNYTYAGTMLGVFVSNNNGASWTQADSGLIRTDIVAFDTVGNTILAGTYNGVYASADNGTTWTQSDNGMLINYDITFYVNTFLHYGSNILAGTADGVFESANDGASWQRISNGMPGANSVNGFVLQGDNIIAATSDGVYISNNGGTSWTLSFADPPLTGILDVAVSGNNIIVGTWNGMYISSNGGASWINSGFQGIPVWSFATKGNSLFMGTLASNGILLSEDNGLTWTEINNGVIWAGEREWVFKDNEIFTSSQGGIYLSTSNGGSWTPVDQGFVTDSFVQAIGAAGNYMYAGVFGAGMWRRSLTNSCEMSVHMTLSPDSAICSGTQVTFTATRVNGGTNPIYEWFVNDSSTASNSPIFQTNNLTDSAVVYCVMKSSLSCAVPNLATSNATTMIVDSSVTPSVTITASPSIPVCKGTAITVTAMPDNAGTQQSYIWYLDGKIAGNDSTSSFTTNPLPLGQHLVYCIMKSNNFCIQVNEVYSDTVILSVDTSIGSSVVLDDWLQNPVCQNTGFGIDAKAVNAGSSPSYNWFVDGNMVDTTVGFLSIFTSPAGTIFTPGMHSVYCTMTSSDSCVMPKTVISDTVTVIVKTTDTPSVKIYTSSISYCQGSPVSFTAMPVHGGTGPSYQWSVDGINTGSNSSTYLDTMFSPGTHLVYCVMTSNDTCVNANSVSSNIITISVNTSVTPSLTISSNPGNTICPGMTVTFTPVSVNGGSAPTYQWLLNGTLVSNSGSSYSSKFLQNDDEVTLNMASNAECANPSIASKTVTITVTTSPPPAPIAISATDIISSQAIARWNVSPRATSYFLDVSTDNSFSKFIPGYNNLDVGNVTSYTVTGLSDLTTYYYRLREADSCSASSNSNTISFTTTACQPLIAGTIYPQTALICSGATTLLSLSGASGGTFQWQISPDDTTWGNVTSGGNDSTYNTSAADGTSNKYYRCLTVNGCYALSSNTAIVDVNVTPVISVTSITDNSITVTWAPASSGCQSNISWSGAAGTGSANAVTTNIFAISGLAPDAEIIITVLSTCSCPGANPASIIAHTLCNAPAITNLAALPLPKHGFKVNWTSVSGATSYRVYYLDISSAGSWSFEDTAGSNKTIFVPYGAHTYAVYVAAKNCPATGDFGQGSTIQYVTTNPPSACTPAPTVTAFSDCPNQLTIDIAGGTPPYEITVRRISPAISAAATYTISSNTVTISIGIQYAGSVWEVFARKDCGTTDVSAPSNISIIPIKPACPVVSNVIASHITCNSFTASWNTNDCSGLGVTEYRVLLKKNGSLQYTTYTVTNTNHDALISLDAETIYNLIVESVTCNGAISVNSVPDTVALPSCRMEASLPQDSTINQTVVEKEAVTLYPNPTSGQFYIDIDRLDNSEAPVKIELLDLLGQVIETNITTIGGGHLTELINTTQSIASGLYFVRTSVGINTYVSRVMIIRE